MMDDGLWSRLSSLDAGQIPTDRDGPPPELPQPVAMLISRANADTMARAAFTLLFMVYFPSV